MPVKKTSGSARHRRTQPSAKVGLWVALGVGLLGLAAVAVFVLFRPANVTEVSASQAYAKQQAGAGVLDVRTAEEWHSGHIANSTLIPLSALPTRLNEVPQQREIIVVCRTGRRSQEAASLLQKAGYTRVVSLRGGLQAWTAAGYPVTQTN